MSSKLLSILTSPFWGPKKLDEIYAAAEKNLETADKLSNETAENLKKTEELYQQISAFQEQQKNVSDAQKEQISQGMDTLKSLMEMLQQSAAGLAEDRKNAKELQANYEKTLHSEISAILSEIKKTSELDRQNISDAKQQVVSNNQTVQALINSANNIISGLKNDREELKNLQDFSEKTLASAEKILLESEENKRQAELILQEAAEKQGQAILIGEQQKKRAAMALNLCTTSISNIIACGNVEAMEQEYNSILNNINLQVIVKDETLLETMRKILDTIAFFRLQEKERKRLEARHHQRMNNLLWDSLSSAGGLFVVGGNPWAIAAAASIQAGSMYVGYQRKKRDVNMQLDDELWKLERSAIEQLHALRASLFETAWRLSDTYDFNDEWRLTVRQIEWFNEIRSEVNHIIRYKKLEQYKDDFEAYPYYWYELGVAAQGADEEEKISNNDTGNHWQKKAKQHFAKFIELDSEFNLLRQDVIGADARLRHVSLLALEQGWNKAVKQDHKFLQAVKRLAVDDPELLLKSALVYASAYRECKEEEYANQAILFFEMLVMRGNNLPMSSIFLSELYLLTNKKDKYMELQKLAAQQNDVRFILTPDTGTADDKYRILSEDYNAGLEQQCLPLVEMFVRDFEIMQKMAHPELFNLPIEQQNEALLGWVQKSFESGQENFKQDLFAIWEVEKSLLNQHFSYAEKSLGLNRDALRKIAFSLNDQAYMKISLISDDKVWIKTARKKGDRCMELLLSMKNWQNSAKKEYVEKIMVLIADKNIANTKGLLPDDINALLAFHHESVIYRNQLQGFSSSVEEAIDNGFDFFNLQGNQNISSGNSSSGESSRNIRPDGCKIHWKECNGAEIDFLYNNCYTYTILCNGIDKPNYDSLEKIIHSRYPDEKTSWRDERHWYGWDWFRKAKAGLVGKQDFEITFFDTKIEILYTKAKDDERERDVKLLSYQAVEREYIRLLTEACSEDDGKRLQGIALQWIRMKFEQIKDETDSKKQEKMRQGLAKEIRKKCKNSKAAEIFAIVLKEKFDTYRLDSEKQKLLPMLDN